MHTRIPKCLENPVITVVLVEVSQGDSTYLRGFSDVTIMLLIVECLLSKLSQLSSLLAELVISLFGKC